MNPFKATMALVLVLGAAQFLAAGAARAQTALTGTQIQALLTTNYACGSSGTEKWDEKLIGGTAGNVTDYKKGPSDPIDPTAVVGTYTIDTGSNTITYSYTGGGVYTYTVTTAGGTAGSPGNYTFANSGTYLISVQAVPCP